MALAATRPAGRREKPPRSLRGPCSQPYRRLRRGTTLIPPFKNDFADPLLAATSTAKPTTIQPCKNTKTHGLYKRSGAKCPKGDKALSWNVTGPKGGTGQAGKTGATGNTGPQGPAGISQAKIMTEVNSGTEFTLSPAPDLADTSNARTARQPKKALSRTLEAVRRIAVLFLEWRRPVLAFGRPLPPDGCDRPRLGHLRHGVPQGLDPLRLNFRR